MTLPQWALEAKRLREAATEFVFDAQGQVYIPITQQGGIPVLPQERFPVPLSLVDMRFYSFAPNNQELFERALELALTALSEAGNYLHWHTDDLSGDDLVGDGRRTRSFNRITSEIEQAIAQIHALGGSDAT